MSNKLSLLSCKTEIQKISSLGLLVKWDRLERSSESGGYSHLTIL